MTLGGYIKDFRTTHNLSMDDFAQRSGLSKAYVSILERNYNPSTKRAAIPSLNTIKRVANSTGLEFNDLLMMLDDNQEVSLSRDDKTVFPPLERLQDLSVIERKIVNAFRQADELDQRLVLRTLKIDVDTGKNAEVDAG